MWTENDSDEQITEIETQDKRENKNNQSIWDLKYLNARRKLKVKYP